MAVVAATAAVAGSRQVGIAWRPLRCRAISATVASRARGEISVHGIGGGSVSVVACHHEFGVGLLQLRTFAASVTTATASTSSLPPDVVAFAATGKAIREGTAEDAATDAFRKLGRYKGNEVAWDTWSENLFSSFAELDIQDFKNVSKILAVDVGLTKASVWERLAVKAGDAISGASLKDLVPVCKSHVRIRAYTKDVFMATLNRVGRESAIFANEPAELTELLEIFSVAGQTAELSRRSRQLFASVVVDRVVEDFEEENTFDVKQCHTIVQAIARLRASELRSSVQEIGRQRIHPALETMSAPDVIALCRAYGDLGHRHDTVFKKITTEILSECEQSQRDLAIGAPPREILYGAGEIATVMLALLRNKMHRGNTEWCRWEDNYQELLDVLVRKMEDEVGGMSARTLAAAAFVLGRARMGNKELVAAMYSRMMTILEGAEDVSPVAASAFVGEDTERQTLVPDDPPQYELEQFLHGIAMMGPQKRKELDTFWLQQWLCTNVHTLLLSDFVSINWHLVFMGCAEPEYLTMLVEQFYVAVNEISGESPIDRLTMTDIIALTHTYNKARLGEEQLGRHFFWALGCRYQDLHVGRIGTRARAAYRRLG
eukprot:TRINITY_DN62747_c0_g1_i1.p1 TRINITY_DN62747_c0_g1~~TRINITY_DN62747_c0_g1_i1.p1  ORF type:complete len:617 (+),score=100.38 TRINITY_DN62747_c0_g1_i1:40-1851(+)